MRHIATKAITRSLRRNHTTLQQTQDFLLDQSTTVLVRRVSKYDRTKNTPEGYQASNTKRSNRDRSRSRNHNTEVCILSLTELYC